MQQKDPELVNKIRQQFDSAPYPKIPLEKSPKEAYDILYLHNLITSYYLRNQKVINTESKVILDAGCGSGYKSLVLAEANPGAKIVGIDLSEKSVDLAQKRLEHYGFTNCEFHAIPIENLPKLGLEFDYINADEVLYLLPDIVEGLKAMKAVLKPEGIIRSNLHSYFQRASYYRAQELFKFMGLMNESPGEMEIEVARETMNSLKDQVLIKRQTWTERAKESDEAMLANHLLMGDKGSTIPELFAALREAELEFISMVNWRYWDLTGLFKEPDNLPAFLAMSLPELSVEEQHHLFELLNPVHRLLDFWCGHPGAAHPVEPVSEWSDRDWNSVTVHLHPQLRHSKAKEDLIQCVQTRRPFEISKYVQVPTMVPLHQESDVVAGLLPLWDEPQPFLSLVERWQKIRTVDPITLEPVSQQTAFEQVKELLSDLDPFLYVLLERSA
ncbi:class I SAM-dependent methyltransferase [Capilliphycus salinus ALCB114379]|uniref:class I SAM-dependent methyltransferase n=1 Tax=Capilliphycus salinus TaxID=2768948 RepID=UPI0039A6F340